MKWTNSYKQHNGIEQGEGVAPNPDHDNPKSDAGCQCDGTGESAKHDFPGGCKAEREAARNPKPVAAPVAEVTA